MDFHAAMETFAEAWVAANTPTAVNTEAQNPKPAQTDELPTLVNKDPNKTIEPNPGPPHSHSTDSSPSGAKSIPIHCVIEQTSGPVTFESNEGASHTTVELDSYAILPSTTLFSELVRASLVKLGYNSTEAMNAKGAIQIKNWKPLLFEVITSDIKATIEDILGELTQVTTLRIRLCSKSKLSTTDEVKDKLLQLLLTQSQGLLVNSGCPIEKGAHFIRKPTVSILSDLLNTEYPNFGVLASSPGDVDISRWTDNTVRCAVMSLLKEMSQSSLAKLCPLTQSAISNIANWKYSNKLSEDKCKEFGDWYMEFTNQSKDFPQDGGPKDSRQTFHPEHEIPLMRKWYQNCKHPTNEKLQFFTDELNRGHVRQERPKVTVSKLKIWWKNERQREKRNELKQTSDPKSKGEATLKTPSANISGNENITVEDVNAQEQNMENEQLKFNQNPQEQNSESGRLKFPVPQYRFPQPEQRIPVIHQPFPFTNPPNPFLYGPMAGQNIREEPFSNPPDG